MGSINIPHAICIPFPAQGHINPMLKLAKILHSKGFHITFVNTEYNHQRLLKTQGSATLTHDPSFQFESIPDGLPPPEIDATQDIPSLCKSTSETCLEPFQKLLYKINDSTTSPPVSCIVSDGVMSFTLDAADKLGIPEVLFWTTSACGFLAYVHYSTLREKGVIPLKDSANLTNGYLDTVVDCIPSMKGIRLKDMPTFLRTTDPNEMMVNFVVRETTRAKKASAIILNTFEDLEYDVLNELSSIYPHVYSIGPLHTLENKIQKKGTLEMLGSSLWKEEVECLKWLGTKESNSVVYVNFGSIAVMTQRQLVEFSWGLANSNQTFLWVIRPDLVSGDSPMLPLEFIDATRERGLLASWCPQEEVLNHPSIGGFLTHSGWNSTLESISSGVPLICWPFFAEQQTNCWYSCNKWGVGMEIDSDVDRKQVEKLVKILMDGEKGKDMKRMAGVWKEKAESMSSWSNIDNLINQVLLRPKV